MHGAQLRNEDWRQTAGFPLRKNAEISSRWDEVPVLPSTVLGLELLLSEPTIDLRQTTGLILSDPGATLHTLRLAGTDDAVRVEDCLAALDFSAWFEMLSAHRAELGPERSQAARYWRHAVEIARHARFVAESIEQIAPDTAYLVGLFHELDTLPRLLGWTNLTGGVPLEGALPLALGKLVEEARGAMDSPWKYVVDAAHQLTCSRPSFCPLIRFSSLEAEAR